MPEVSEPSAVEWLRRLDSKELSARELVVHVLARIDSSNPSINAVVARDDEAALKAADEADRARSRGERLPLLGLPLTVKDSIEAAGLVSACGSFAREGYVPENDATAVARLRAAGMIVIAKTNVPEYAWSYETENVLYGRTVHPLDPTRTCGGSSGGEAALLAAGGSVVGIGTDAGGSIRVPSHYCGTAGLRPSAGLVPETGCWPSTRDSGMFDLSAVGPMARSVADLALLLPVLAGRDDIDPFVHEAGGGDAEQVRPETLRVGVYTDDGVWPVTEGTRTAVEAAAETLAAAGCRVMEVVPPTLAEATELFFTLMAADGGARARSDLAPAGGRHVRQLAALLDDLVPLALDASGYFGLLRRFFAFRARIRRFVGGYDIVLAPTTPGPAPPHGCVPGTETPLESYDAFNNTHTYSVAGLPVAVVQAGVERGLPIGVQLIANAFSDHVALAAAAVIERSRGSFESLPVDPAGELA